MSEANETRVAVFVDVQNLYYGAKHQFSSKINFEKLLTRALDGRQHSRAVAYVISKHKDFGAVREVNFNTLKEEDKIFARNTRIGSEVRITETPGNFNGARWFEIVEYKEETGEAKVIPSVSIEGFKNILTDCGFEVKSKPLIERANGVTKGNWDVQMVVDIIRQSDKCDVIVLASGDGDFLPAIEYVQQKGVKVEILSFKESTAKELIEKADKFIEVTEDLTL